VMFVTSNSLYVAILKDTCLYIMVKGLMNVI